MTIEERFIKVFGNSPTTRLAAKVRKAFKPSDLMHVAFILGRKLKGFDDTVANDVATRFPDYAKKLIAR